MAVLLGANSAMYLDLWVGNFNSIQVGLIVAYVALHAGRRRDLLAGALLGFAIALKPNLVLLAVVVMFALVIQRRWRGFVVHGTGLAIGGVAGLGAGVARFGSLDPWFAWLGTWRDTGFRDYWKMEWGNFSIVRFLWEETGFDASLAVLTAGLAATVVVLLLDARRRPRFADARDAEDRRIARELLLVGIAVAITLLASPLTHQHYYLLLTPLIIFLVRPVGWQFGGATDPRVRLAVSVIAMVLISVWLVQGWACRVTHSRSDISSHTSLLRLCSWQPLFGRSRWISRQTAAWSMEHGDGPRERPTGGGLHPLPERGDDDREGHRGFSA